MSTIVETGAVIAHYPFDGKWSPCVRREGEVCGKKVGPHFASETEAAKFAGEYLKLDFLRQAAAHITDPG